MAKKNGRLLHSPGKSSFPGSLGLKDASVAGLVKAIRSGLSFASLARFERHSGLSLPLLAKVLCIPPRTLARRKSDGTLTSEESERLLRLAGLFDQTVALFEGSSSAAAKWLQAPSQALGNVAPLTLAETEIGARAVEDLIGRLEHGVYS
jgi:putative toxin-antitoxin system antitoxin component (TIGR02293 family)